MSYSSLVLELVNEGVEVIEHKFSTRALKGLYFDNVIAINYKCTANEKEKACILAEEYGHYRTSYGNILDQKKVTNVKQEKRARNWAYEKLIPLEKLIDAYKAGVCNRYDLADFLDVTEDFLMETLAHYSERYGRYTDWEDYRIYFSPLVILHFL